MAKYCPKCGETNKDTSVFCENCGAEIPKTGYVPSSSKIPPESKSSGGWWSQQSSGVKAGIAIGGICCIGIIVVIVLLGVFFPDQTTFDTNFNTTVPSTTTVSGQTYSNGDISFKYPDSFEDSTMPDSITSGDSSWKHLDYMSNSDGISIRVDRNTGDASPTASRDATESDVESLSTGKIISTSTETNPNNIVVARSTNSLEDPSTGDTLLYYDMFFKASNGDAYYISVWGVQSLKQDIKNTAQTIFKTLK